MDAAVGIPPPPCLHFFFLMPAKARFSTLIVLFRSVFGRLASKKLGRPALISGHGPLARVARPSDSIRLICVTSTVLECCT